MEKIVIVVKGGMIRNVYGSGTHEYDVEVIDLDLDLAAPAVVEDAMKRLQSVEQHLCEIY